MTTLPMTTLSTNELCLAVISLFNLGIAVLVLIKQPRRLVNRAFTMVAIGIFTWGTGIILLSRTLFFEWNTVIMYGFVILLYGLVVFAKVFPNTTRISSRFYIRAALPLLLIIILTPMHLIVRSGIFHPGSNPEPVNGPFFPVLVILSAAYVGMSLYLFMQTYRRSRGREREQMRYFLFGLSVFAICAFLFDILLPSFGIFKLNFLGPISSVILTGVTAYAIVRHELLDIRFAIQRGLVYTILSGLVVGLYIVGLEASGYFLHVITQESAIISAGITTTVGVFFLKPLENYFRKRTDHIFFKGKYDYATALHTLSRVLLTSLDRADILAQSEANLKKIFKTDSVDFIFDPAAIATMSAEQHRAGFATLTEPIMFEQNSIGLLKLGAKRSGDSYTKEDLQLVSTFAYQAAVAIGKADLHRDVQRYTTHLESLVEERTSEIKTMQEDQKQTMIDISHNLQTPLAIIRGELEMLGDDAEDLEKVQSVRKSLDRVSGFIRQLLHLARLEHSLYTVERSSLDLSLLMREQSDYFEVMAAEQGVRIETAIEDGCRILGNKRLLEEALANLVTNAIAYRERSRDSLTRITLEKCGESAVVTICDNGIGISKKDLSDIFLRFYRVPQATPTLQGTGLGLAIVRNIVEKHEGTIEVRSTFGEGTTFILAFPLKK
jgi:signal transduction histidine kinase